MRYQSVSDVVSLKIIRANNFSFDTELKLVVSFENIAVYFNIVYC